MNDPIIMETGKAEWVQGPYGGSRMKTFFTDQIPNCFAMLIELAPGSTLDRHEEPLFEISYILQGNCTCGEGKEYPAGTFLFTPKGITHGPFRSSGGCIFLCIKFDR
jgi:quercetin dioxygenase-like cupin family protein